MEKVIDELSAHADNGKTAASTAVNEDKKDAAYCRFASHSRELLKLKDPSLSEKVLLAAQGMMVPPEKRITAKVLKMVVAKFNEEAEVII